MAQIKRSQVATFINTTPDAVATYELLGLGVTDAQIAYNPKTTEEHYIHQDSATIMTDGYAPNIPVESSAYVEDAVFVFIDELRKARAVLGDAETDIVNVWLYETPTLTEYPAEQQPVSIQIDDFGGAGGVATKINFTINYIGDPVRGMFDPATKAFTPNA